MGDLGIYDIEDVSYSVSLDDIEPTSAEYHVACSEDYNRKFIPETIAPRIEGTRNVDLGYLGDGEWVLLKSRDSDHGEIAASHVGAQQILDETELNFPEMDYSEDSIIIEHVGNLESPVSALNQDEERYDDLVEAIAGKAILGDNDLGGNIGFANGNFYIYDFDRAGSPINGMEEPVYDYMRRIDRLTNVEPRIEDVELAMEDLACSFDITELESKLNSLLDSIDQKTERRFMKIGAADFISNINRVREESYFKTEICDKVDDLEEEEPDNSNDVFRQNIQEVMLD